MKQLSLKEVNSQLSTCEWFQLEKESYALSSPYRPEVENTLHYCFRQTSFPHSLIRTYQNN
ncbi:hypothetical protein BKP35_02150 [Anaerobacillus arseniciselenatis]|uniref:Uncharacterized protein n=1 Tax=Anaerobacillus arseniciselenatis TaxID=85682 RepID=A0A1S2LWT8_9BACI|nr:hypothetical protein [Anaerobacillus arseniciselenatis]OIJ15815.1 hypothetical protein BKP35_02150 [Anaerobacillus arseniciselenatis]